MSVLMSYLTDSSEGVNTQALRYITVDWYLAVCPTEQHKLYEWLLGKSCVKYEKWPFFQYSMSLLGSSPFVLYYFATPRTMKGIPN